MKRLLLLGALVPGLLLAAGSVSIDVSLSPVGGFTAKSDKVEGFATKKGDAFVAKNVTLKINSLNSDVELRDRHMNDNYFEVAKHPTAIVSAAKGQGGKFAAFLEIRKQKKKITGTYTVSGSKIVFKFKTALSDYNIKKANYMGVGVKDSVDVTVEIPIK